MKIPIDPKEREQILNQLRMAVAFQIKLWDALSSISEANDCDFDQAMNFVNATAITAHDGMDLNDADLDEFLGIGVPDRPLEEGQGRFTKATGRTEDLGE